MNVALAGGAFILLSIIAKVSGVAAALSLVVWDIDEDTGARSIRDIKEQDVYMGDMPLMTDKRKFFLAFLLLCFLCPRAFAGADMERIKRSGVLLYSEELVV